MKMTAYRSKGSSSAAGFALLVLCLLLPGHVVAQWSTPDGDNRIGSTNLGVGVGTNTPLAKLDVRGGTVVIDASQYLGFRRSDNNAIRRLIGAADNGTGQHFIDVGQATGYITGIRFWPRDDINHPDVIFNSSGNVGVGTGVVQPIYRLHLAGNNTDAGGRAAVKLQNTQAGGHSWLLWAGAKGQGEDFGLYDETAGLYRMFFRGDGKVGVGTESPTGRLHVSAGSGQTGLEVSVGYGSYAARLHGDNGTGGSLGLYVNAGTNNSDYAVRFRNYAESADYLVVRGDGNVGIGTASPSYKLEVNGSVNASGLCLGGSCRSTWAEVSGGGSQWANGGSGAISYSAGRVGVGVGVPLGPLSVGDASVEGSDGYLVIGKRAGAGTRQFRVGFDQNFNFVIGDYGGGNVAGTWRAPFAINWDAPNHSLYVNAAGSVGIGTSTPESSYKLQVAGAVGVGSLTATGKITGGSVEATYQDVAEWVPSVQKLTAGTVVVLDAERVNHVLASASAYDTKVAGVVSAQPGVILGVGGEGKVMVATTGRVKVKVDATRGAIRIGDLIVTSEVAGVAMRSMPVEFGGMAMHRPGTIIGKALEPLEKGTSEILVLLSLQ